MEPQKYYEFKNGIYCVHFANKQGRSIEEITKIFSEFGNVVGVTAAGDDHGYRFVRYRHVDEVLRCIEGVRNHPTIKLKLKDPNHTKNKNQTNNGTKTEFHDNNRRYFETPAAEKSPKSLEEKTQYSNNNISTAYSKDYSPGERKKNDGQGVTKKAAEDLETKVKILQEPPRVTFDPCKPPAPLRHPEVAAETFMPAYAKTSCNDNVRRCAKPLNISLGFEKKFKSKAVANKPVITATSSDVPLVQPNVAEEIPNLVMKYSPCGTAENDGEAKFPQDSAVAMPATVTAEEVVVANIHTDYGVHYILHLIRKHDPLSVSEMKIIPSLGLRYCIVYLQSIHQAIAIEKELDNFKLCGKDLIVMRSQRLALIN